MLQGVMAAPSFDSATLRSDAIRRVCAELAWTAVHRYLPAAAYVSHTGPGIEIYAHPGGSA